MDAEDVIRLLNLKPLQPEGGYYRETYRDGQQVKTETGDLPLSSAIYYLVTPDQPSHLHRLSGAEVYHFYAGDPVSFVSLDEGKLNTATLGSRFDQGQVPQLVVPRGVWQGLQLAEGGRWALLGTTMSPGFDYAEFELATEGLLQQHADLAEELRPLILKRNGEP